MSDIAMYFVTGLDHVDYDKIGYEFGVVLPKTHTFGYFRDLDGAKKAVEGNETDINEGGYYKFMVIEKIDEGYCYPVAREMAWYKWEDGKYIQMLKPTSTKSTCNFAF